MKRLDEFMFLFMMFLFATGWGTGWPFWNVVALIACVAFVLVRSFGPKIKELLGKTNAEKTSEENTEK